MAGLHRAPLPWLVPLALFACARGSHPTPRAAGEPAAAVTANAEPARGQTRAAARHLLDRLAFGPKPGEVDRVVQMGARAWFEHQLRAEELPDPRSDRAVLPYRRALAPPERLPDLFAQGGMTPEVDAGDDRRRQSRQLLRQTSTEQLLLEVQMAEIVRHVESEYQLREVMVDFWTNHFTVFAKKEEVRLLAGDYVERVIRPLALDRFEALLVATAQHPAMLRYLDNASSRAKAKGRPSKQRGVSENYARELLELHTLGVDGGYAQSDVIAVARILTGWTFSPGPDGRGYVYRFDSRIHDRKAKTTLGLDFAPGGNEEEGLRLLEHLARHEATASHLAHKLCVRFVADEPPPACVHELATAFLATGGDIKATLRALFDSPTLWATENQHSKLKTPLEFLISAVRGVDARLVGTTELARSAARLGEAPFVDPSPAGRREDSAHWLKSYTMARLGFAHDMAFGRVAGVVLDRPGPDMVAGNPSRTTVSLCRGLLGENVSPQTKNVIEQALHGAEDDDSGLSSALALALSAPEFQWR